jgi:hypothetical protein
MPKFLLLFLLISFSAFSQKIISGVVSDTLNKPLESANLIAKPSQEKAGIKCSSRKYSRVVKYFCPFKNVQNKSSKLHNQNVFLVNVMLIPIKILPKAFFFFSTFEWLVKKG